MEGVLEPVSLYGWLHGTSTVLYRATAALVYRP